MAPNPAEIGMIANVLESPLPANRPVFDKKDTRQQPGVPNCWSRTVPFLHRLQCLHPDAGAEDLTQAGFTYPQFAEDLSIRIRDCTSLRPEFVKELTAFRQLCWENKAN